MRIGSRGSALALVQARQVAALLAGRQPEIVVIRTSGEEQRREGEQPRAGGEQQRGAGAAAGQDKSRWVDTIEQALLDGEIDLAVHSAKDLPGDLRDGLALLGAPARAAVQDVLCGAGALEELAPGAAVGTKSLRRAAQLLAARPDLEVVSLSGNVDTRLAKLADDAAGISAIVLAEAGLLRLGRGQEIGAMLDPARFVPSPGQGVLALEGRAGDARVREAAAEITDPGTFACLKAERAVATALAASCNTPLGAHAELGEQTLHLRAWVGLPDGSQWIADELEGPVDDPEGLGAAVAEHMRLAGADELLTRAEEMAGVV